MGKASQSIERRVVIIGTGGCGKTCILHRIANKSFPDEYIPTVFEDTHWTTRVNGREISLILKDTAGQEEYDRLIYLSVVDADILVFCYAVNSRRSFEEIENKYTCLVSMSPINNENVIRVLVGNKTDLRDSVAADGRSDFVTTEEGVELGKSIGASWVFECSAKNNTGIAEMFDVFARWAVESDGVVKEKRGGGGFLSRFFGCCSCCK